MATVGILVLFLILEESFQLFTTEYDIRLGHLLIELSIKRVSGLTNVFTLQKSEEKQIIARMSTARNTKYTSRLEHAE